MSREAAALRSSRLSAGALVLGLLSVTACTDTGSDAGPPPMPPATAPPSPSPQAPASSASQVGERSAQTRPTSASPSPSGLEATTTNTLPPPPAPSRAAPSTAGKLTARSLPVPAGWKTVARKGGSEEGYQGNGTWVHARDPRYAAHDVITLGCADITRDDYPDPVSALEGTYQRSGQPGIGLVLQFADAAKAKTYATAYRRQVASCRGADPPVRAKILPSSYGLIDQRSSSDGDWTEAVRLQDSRLTLVILSDPGHRVSRAQVESLLQSVPQS